jgi:hypothetical protein
LFQAVYGSWLSTWSNSYCSVQLVQIVAHVVVKFSIVFNIIPLAHVPGLLPRVISGSSGGSIVAGVLAIHTDVEMKNHVLHPGVSNMYGVKYVTSSRC